MRGAGHDQLANSPSWKPISGAFYHANVLRARTAVPAITVKAKVLFLNLSWRDWPLPWLTVLKDGLATEGEVFFVYLFTYFSSCLPGRLVSQLSFQHMTKKVEVGLKGHETRPQSQRGAEDERALSTPLPLRTTVGGELWITRACSVLLHTPRPPWDESQGLAEELEGVGFGGSSERRENHKQRISLRYAVCLVHFWQPDSVAHVQPFVLLFL